MHPNLIQLFGVVETSESIHVIMEFVHGGDLFDNICEEVYTEKDAQIVMASLLSALQFLHSKKTVHRDLKPENILCNLSRVDIKLADFGMSNWLPDGDRPQLRSQCGTYVFMAPEMLQRHPYNESVDVWSAGILMYILMSGSFPFFAEDPTEFTEIILDASELKFLDDEWGATSETPKNLIRKILEPDPRKRPTIHDILADPWFTS